MGATVMREGGSAPSKTPLRAIVSVLAVLIVLGGCTAPEPGRPANSVVPNPPSQTGSVSQFQPTPPAQDMPGLALSALRSPGFAMGLSVTGTLTFGDVTAGVSGTGELRTDSSHLLLSFASPSLIREGIVAGDEVYERSDGGPWTRARRRPGDLARDPADAGATVRLSRIIERIEELSQSGWVAGDGGTLYRLSPSAVSPVTPSDLGLAASTTGFAGSLQVLATWAGLPRMLVLDVGWIDPATEDRCSWHLEVALAPSAPTAIAPPSSSWRSFRSDLDGYRISYPPSWSIAECTIGGLSGRCLSAGRGTSELLIRRFAPGPDRSIEGLAAAQQSALQEGVGLELTSTEQLPLGLQEAALLTYKGWEATVRQVLTVRGNDAYSLLWLSHGRADDADRAQLSRFLSTFEPSGSSSRAPRPGEDQAASVPELEAGAAGPAVLSLQTRLAALHYDIGAVDGTFGDDTSHAVVAFQKVNGLAPTGIADTGTWSALFHPFVPKAKYDYLGASIEVDLTKQVVYLVRDGKIDSIYDASTGGGYVFESRGVTKIAITPTGTYRIYMQIDGWYESSVGFMYRSSFFLRGFALHGEIEVPPYPASHGCVRVTLSAINRLWPSLYLGMLVSIYRT